MTATPATPTRPRRARPGAVLAATSIAVLGLLAACDKPSPNVTLQSGATSIVVEPQLYTYTGGPLRIKDNSIGHLSVNEGGTILVDVPKTVAQSQWLVQSGIFPSPGTFAPTTADQSPIVHHDDHSQRINVEGAAGSTYYVVVKQYRNTKNVGVWVTEVKVRG
jgi:hypothetical protein